MVAGMAIENRSPARLTLCLALLIILGLDASGIAQERFYYSNSRFGFSFEYPPYFRLQEEPPSGDGAIFGSINGGAELRAYASFPLFGDVLSEQRSAADFRTDEGDRITYSPSGRNWYVLSGYTRTGRIFYERTASLRDCENSEIFATVLIEYDPADKKTIEDDLGWITKSLRGCN